MIVRVVVYALTFLVQTSFQVLAFRASRTPKARVLGSGRNDFTVEKPRWAGSGSNDVLSQAVNALISFKPLFGLMKIAARDTLIKTAERNGIPWRERAETLMSQKAELYSLIEKVEDKSLIYPEYYTKEFHAYDEGNLNLKAAVECESATMSMALRVWPNDGLSAEAAQDRLRYSFLDAVRGYLNDVARLSNDPTSILDVGASVGISTFYLARFFPKTKNIVGVDLSPHFLSIALQRQNDPTVRAAWKSDKLERISWKHGKAENLGFADNSFDLTTASFMFHELPQKISLEIIKEMYRVTKKGGIVAITDNNPKSQVIQNLPPVLFTLMKSTEPWSDEYYTFDLEKSLEQNGFSQVTTVASDPRHRTVLAYKR